MTMINVSWFSPLFFTFDLRQAFLSQSEDDRAAAEAREAAAVSEAKGMQQAVRAAEERLQDANAELEVT